MSQSCCLQILIIEDEPGLCDLAEYIATDLGCSVLKANTQSEGIDLLKANPAVRLGLFDFHLPDASGEAGWGGAISDFLTQNGEVRYYFLTGDLEITSEKARRMGAIDVIHKPITSEELQTLIKSFIKVNHRTICCSEKQLCPNV